MRSAVVGLLLLEVTAAGAYYAALARVMVRELHMNDFGKFYYSARLFLANRDMYGPSPATLIPVSENMSQSFWNMNPPHFHLLVLPLAPLDPSAAPAVWTVASFAALGVSVWLITRELGIGLTPPRALWMLTAFTLFSGTSTLVVTGQLSWLLLLPMTLGWVAARRGR